MINKTFRLFLFAWIFGIADHSCIAADDERRPDEHFCPITLEVMRDPVVAADGHSYERTALLQHFKTNEQTSPSTGEPLNSREVFDNQALKVMIGEWRPGRQNEPSVLETRDADSIAQRVREEFGRNAALLNAAKDQNIVAFLGNTGAGKSTLINFLAGKELQESSDGEEYVLVHPDDTTAMAIGSGGRSETLYPKCIDVDGLRFFDLPGFNDTDGSERTLVNAAFIRQILLDAASVRLVFVAGYDQFTADRSTSVKQMFNAIKQLFVADQTMSLVDDGIFVATKVTCNEQTETTEFLLKRTNSEDKTELNTQLRSWNSRHKLARMFHPLRKDSNRSVRNEILGMLREARAEKIRGVNISVLYPPETKAPLERMFCAVMEGMLARKFTELPTTLSEYDRAIALYASDNFWQEFNDGICRGDDAIGLLKEFCINPYIKALRRIEGENEGRRQAHIQVLRTKRQERIEYIERRTGARTRDVISALVPKQDREDFVFFDFAYHREYHDQICGGVSIVELATDAQEQEVVRSSYAGFISRHSHEQMRRWHQKFSGIEELTRRMNDMDREIKRLTALEVGRSAAIQPPPVPAIERPIKRQVLPEIASGYEEIYLRFLNGKLVYRPNEGSDAGKIELPIAALANPLEGTFDLRSCGDAENYLSISTGYRKGMKEANRNKVEVCFAPRFLIERELGTTAGHFRGIMNANRWPRTAEIGIFWTWGGCDNLNWYQYLTTNTIDQLGDNHLYEHYTHASRYTFPPPRPQSHSTRHFMLFLN